MCKCVDAVSPSLNLVYLDCQHPAPYGHHHIILDFVLITFIMELLFIAHYEILMYLLTSFYLFLS